MLAKGSNGEDSTQTECNPTVPPRTTWLRSFDIRHLAT